MATDGAHHSRGSEPGTADTVYEEPLPALLCPSLLAGLDSGDERTAHTAGYGLYLVSRAHTSAVEAVSRDLAGRLVADERRPGVCRTLASLRLVDDGAVREALLDVTSGDRARRLYALVSDADPWEPPPALPAEGDHAEYLAALRQVIDPDEGRPDPADDPASRTDVIREDGTADRDRPDGEQTTGPADASGSGSDSVRTTRDRIEALAASETFAALVHRSGFDELQVTAPLRTRRYAESFRARARTDDTERGVAVRLLDAPGGESELGEQLSAWARLVDASGVVTVVDWGTSPRPWVATECIERRLAGREPAPAEALDCARRLAGTLAQLHQRDVVHAGIDPYNVAYASTFEDRVRPMFDNVGLLSAYRYADDASDYLDPRYAAPEYFDSQYGRIDHATDIYQLGMVVYRLLAGRHPFDGSYDAVRAGVLNDRPPAPSQCTPALPAAVDDVVAKATATQKLTRYETAQALYRDLARICERLDDEKA